MLEANYQKIPDDLKRRIMIKIILHNAHEKSILEYCGSLVAQDLTLYNKLKLFPTAVEVSLYKIILVVIRFMVQIITRPARHARKLFYHENILYGLAVVIFFMQLKNVVQRENVEFVRLQLLLSVDILFPSNENFYSYKVHL